MERSISSTLIGILSSIIISTIHAVHLPPIYWNSTSEMFLNNVEFVLTVRLMDTVDIHCPFYNDTVTQDEAEYSIIYSVSKDGYENCYLDEDAHPIAQCLSPFGVEPVMKLTIRDYSPLPNAVEYFPGETYYFISTSDGTQAGLRNRKGGLCDEWRMRMKVKVMDRDEPAAAANSNKPTTAPSIDSDAAPVVGGTPHQEQDDTTADAGKMINSDDHRFHHHPRGWAAAVRKQQNEDRGKEIKEGDDADEKAAVRVNFIPDDAGGDKPSTPTKADNQDDYVTMDKRPQSDGRTNTLIYDPYGIEITAAGGNGGVKREKSWPRRHHQWHDPRAGRADIVMYEVHEMDAQPINRFETASSTAGSSMSSPPYHRHLFLLIITVLTFLQVWWTRL